MSLHKNHRGPGVRVAQERLNQWLEGVQASGGEGGVNPLVADGHYGDNTSFLVTRFQAFSGLPVTGAIDDDTAKALGCGVEPEAEG